MPELPEVETSRRGIEPFLLDREVEAVTVRERRLRWPIPADFEEKLKGHRIRSLRRRAKYILMDTADGSAILHLGMSGSLRIVEPDEPAGKHDHVDIRLDSGKALRFRDPRRFGCLLWAEHPEAHPLLKDLGPEPLSDAFDGAHLYKASRGRRIAVKPFIMNAAVVVGVGNIYASEALFDAGIHPKRSAGRIAAHRYESLAGSIRSVLERAIRSGGTTLRDFHGGTGEPGYFRQKLNVYDRADEPCRHCDAPIRSVVLGQRSTYYCAHCQR